MLPGSHEEKISQLGASLFKMTRLKELDLSCNALDSLEGLSHLGLLEKLNLYFNRIPDRQVGGARARLTPPVTNRLHQRGGEPGEAVHSLG